MTERTPTILIESHNAFTNRYFLRSGVLDHLLAAGARVVILSPHAREPYFRREFDREGVALEWLDVTAADRFVDAHPLERWLRQLRALARSNSTCIEFEYRKFKRKGWRRSPATWPLLLVSLGLITLLRHSRLARAALLRLHTRRLAGDFHGEVLDRWRPDLVVTPSLGTFHPNAYIMRQAARRGIKVAALVLSWDNTSTMGMSGAEIDHVIAWTDTMKQELVDDHDFAPAAVTVCGIAHYDRYVDPAFPLPEAELRRRLRIPDGPDILLFGVGMPSLFHDFNIEMVDLLAAAAAAGRFKRPVHLVVRMHPNYWMRTPTQRVNEALAEALIAACARHAGVSVCEPQFLCNELHVPYDLSLEDQRTLASLLKYSRVVVSQFSTLVLESSLFDTPSINVLFDRPNPRLEVSQVDLKSFAHLQRIIATQGSPMAETPEELLALLERYIADPALDRAGRAQIRRNECGPEPGTASRRIADALLACARPGR